MVAHVGTVAFLGLEACSVDVQVQVTGGQANFIIVGLPDKAVRESRERVQASLDAIGLALPSKRVIVNLSPADLPKEGSHFDLAIALGLLAAMGLLDAEMLSGFVVVGELGLDGRIAPVPGVLLAAFHAAANDLGLICPGAQGGEAAWAGEVDVIAAPDLLTLINHLKGVQLLSPPLRGIAEMVRCGPDLAEIKGQETAKRALEIAAAGGHNLLMSGVDFSVKWHGPHSANCHSGTAARGTKRTVCLPERQAERRRCSPGSKNRATDVLKRHRHEWPRSLIWSLLPAATISLFRWSSGDEGRIFVVKRAGRSRVMGIITVSLRMAIPLACLVIATPLPAQAKGDESALRELPGRFCAAWAAHDGHALAAIMADDVDFVTVGATWFHGRADFETYHTRLLNGRFRESTNTPLEIDVRFLRPDMAAVRWTWSIDGDKDADGTHRPKRFGLMTMIAERRKGDWLVVAAQNTNAANQSSPEANGIRSPIAIPRTP